MTALQNRLVELGYLEKGQADGNYGLKTAEAITRFQKLNGLYATALRQRDPSEAVLFLRTGGTGRRHGHTRADEHAHQEGRQQ